MPTGTETNQEAAQAALQAAVERGEISFDLAQTMLNVNSLAREIRTVTDEVTPEIDYDENMERALAVVPQEHRDAMRQEFERRLRENPNPTISPEDVAREVAPVSTRLESEWQHLITALNELISGNRMTQDNVTSFLAEFTEAHDLQRQNGVWSRDLDEDPHAPADTYVPATVLEPSGRGSR